MRSDVREKVRSQTSVILVYLTVFCAFQGQHLTQKDTILVTAQYRLGSLGYFSTAERDAAGNAGLFDLRAVMAWVRILADVDEVDFLFCLTIAMFNMFIHRLKTTSSFSAAIKPVSW